MRILPNLIKIPLFLGLMVAADALAWMTARSLTERCRSSHGREGR
jgi:hypothetical protein